MLSEKQKSKTSLKCYQSGFGDKRFGQKSGENRRAAQENHRLRRARRGLAAVRQKEEGAEQTNGRRPSKHHGQRTGDLRQMAEPHHLEGRVLVFLERRGVVLAVRVGVHLHLAGGQAVQVVIRHANGPRQHKSRQDGPREPLPYVNRPSQKKYKFSSEPGSQESELLWAKNA